MTLQNSENKLSSIASIKKLGGIELSVVRTKIKTAIVDLFEYYGENLTPQSFNALISDFEKKGYMFNGADLELFFSNCQSGKYKNRVETIEGKEFKISFFRLTPNVFIEWLLIYIDERCATFEAMQTKPNLSVTQKEVELLKAFADANLKKFPKPELKEVEENKTDYFEPAKKLQAFLEAEFKTNELIERTGDWKELPYAMFGELRLTKHEYIAARFNQLYENWYSEYSQIETEITVTDFLTNQINNLTQ